MPVGSRFKVKLIHGYEDLAPILELRSVCFVREFTATQYDISADHLVIEDVEKSLLVGAYRLTNSESSNSFESQDDFNLKGWLEKPGAKVELAWACTRPGYRQGSVIALLWKGLATYLKANNVQYLFGPASLGVHPAEQVGDVLKYLKAHRCDLKDSGIEAKQRPFLGALNLDFVETVSNLSQVISKRKLPALMRAYLMAGALVLLQPVFDPDTNCFDFMTVLELDHCNDSIRQHFNL